MKTNTFRSVCTTGLAILLATFSNAQNIFIVTDTIDSNNPGSLRYAFDQVNLAVGPSIIKFNVVSPGTNPVDFFLDTVLGVLPPLTKTVTIDGTTQPGYSPDKTRIRITGVPSPSAAFMTGIVFNGAPESKLLAVRVVGFKTGVSIQSSNYCEVINCAINRCVDYSLMLTNSSHCVVKSNVINTDRTGTNLYPLSPGYNSEEGIYITNTGVVGSSYNIIGGQGCGEGNVIAYTKSEGIDTYGGSSALNVGNVFSGNRIYENVFNAIDLRSAANGNIQPPVITTPANCILSGTSATPFAIVEVFTANKGSTDKKSARLFLGATTANVTGAWSINLGHVPGSAVTATLRDPVSKNTSELANAVPIDSTVITSLNRSFIGGEYICLGHEFTYSAVLTDACNPQIIWDFGDSPPSENPVHVFSAPGHYTITAKIYTPSGCSFISRDTSITIDSIPCPPPCEGCIASFAPDAGEYMITAWAKKETAGATDITYTTPRVSVVFPSSSVPTLSFLPNGQIIDGWQRIEGQFTVPTSGVFAIRIDLECLSGTGNCLFDDIRIIPYDGSMKSYVYDPVTMKLVAELDERHYTTFYEYDEEGRLVRVKKETEKGIMTIKENRDNSNKRKP